MTSHGIMDTQLGLPKQFVASLKILFDILDEDHTGLIRLRDVESRWSDEGVKDLPSGVMVGLRKVVPPNGLLSFECFVAGLKLALFQGHEQHKRLSVAGTGLMQKENRSPSGSVPFLASPRLSSSPNPPLQSSPGNRQQPRSASPDKASSPGKPRSAIPQLQQKSPQDNRPATAAVKPQPSSGRHMNNPSFPPPPLPSTDHPHSNYATGRSGPPPPRPERSHNPHIIRKSPGSGPDVNPPQVPPRGQNQKIVNDLKNWQRDWVGSKSIANKSGPATVMRERPKPSDDPQHAIYANIEQFQRKQEEVTSPPPGGAQHTQGPGKATVRRHGSGRRHTLQNGVDQNMVKRLQQLEEEGAVLKRGLEMVDVARDWYARQLAALQDKQRMLGKVNYNDNSLEAHQERMNFQRARISEVNMQLRTLVDSSEKGFPLHMNLALTANRDKSDNNTVTLVRDHNRRLTQELNDKTDKISKLEQEKGSLIRELFESRSKHKSNYDDTTFM